ncbi:Ig-like domain-containing protein [Deinococcus koreensis]|nr:Ig-like domain-containing protein [Deinococcus koreensis]
MSIPTIRLTAASLVLTALLAACTPPNPPDQGPGPGPEPTDSAIVSINFQPAASPVPTGYLADTGAAYTDARKFGWVRQDSLGQPSASHVPLDITANTRDRDAAGVDARLKTLIHMQYTAGSSSQGGVSTPAAWEYALANGSYTVTVAVGDPLNTDSSHAINLEGQPAITAFAPSNTQRFTTLTRRVTVSDGRLTVEAKGSNTKLDYVIIAPGERPSVSKFSPQDGQTLVDPAAGLAGDLNLLNSSSAKGNGVDPATLTSSTIKLTEVSTNAAVPFAPNTSGGGDVLVVKPSGSLKPNTKYRLEVTSGVKDVNGVGFLPVTTTFVTGSGSTTGGTLAFDQVALPTVPSENAYTSVEIGKDGKLYASTLDGKILRFPINADGTLGAAETLTSLRDRQGPRTIIGLKFDPASTADNLILWISNNEYYDVVNKKTPADWSGKITRLSGPNLENVQDYVVGLPRSVKDHMTNSVNFKTDNAGRASEPNVLYILQGSQSAMGAADPTWGNRPERLLSASLLRLDLNKLPAGSLPLDAKTGDGGTYNPYAPGAPLTLYATGIRNAYDMVWHTNGQLYVPTNGSAAGGNTPGTPAGTIPCADGTTYTGESVPALAGASTQNDYLFRVVPGGYYGHPNPLRCQFVMNGGNPTNMTDPAEVVPVDARAGYPVGTKPDANYRGFAFNFGEHASANGAIEEYTTSGTSALRNKLLVVRYSKQKDIVVLSPGADLNIASAQEGVAGLAFATGTSTLSPLDLTENRTNGYLYVALLDESTGKGSIRLARPK